ncbi:hypothetical protein WD019_15480 [Fictibacillus sp. Mic-4]|uniref:hypothetical protein n=1 Tax=Fictibacillus sp. Mic-4 TaxID=3132826 RepID=UPI003CF2BF7D
MKFTVFKLSSTNNYIKLKKQKSNFFFSKPDDITVFHFNEIKNDLLHVVFRVSDEYLIGTKKGVNHLNLPFSQFVNSFLFKDKGFFLIESIDPKYVEEIVKYIKKNTGMKLDYYPFNKKNMGKMVSALNAHIKKVEYSNDVGDDFYKDFVKFEEFERINNENNIEYIVLSVKDRFVSINSKGIISVDNSDEDFLINFTEVIVNALSNN